METLTFIQADDHIGDLKYTFPFEGNGNKTIAMSDASNTCILEIHFPVWREWKLAAFTIFHVISACLRYTFPFEGNWNVSCSSNCSELTGNNLRYTFPFEGNWNPITQPRNYHCCTLRYTFPFEGNWNTVCRFWFVLTTSMLEIHFPVWRELKPNHPFQRQPLSWPAWDTLSRLKGMET